MGSEWNRLEGSIVFVHLDTKRADGVLQCAPFGGDDSSHFCFEECWGVLKQGRLYFVFHFVSSKPEKSEYDGYNVKVHGGIALLWVGDSMEEFDSLLTSMVLRTSARVGAE